MKRGGHLAVCLTFIVILGGLFLASLLFPGSGFSPTENRVLAAFPEVTAGSVLSAGFMEDFEEYAADSFVLREKWVAFKAGFQLFWGHKENNGTFFCRDNTLISPIKLDDKGEKSLAIVASFAEKYEGGFTLALIPAKQTVWKDMLPKGAVTFDEMAVIEAAKDLGIDTADVAGALLAHGDEGVFYRLDHHWTGLGAYYGYEAVCEALGLEARALTAFDKAHGGRDFKGSDYAASGGFWLEGEAIEGYSDGREIEVFDHSAGVERRMHDYEHVNKYDFFLGGNGGIITLKNGETGGKKLLIIRDSYADSVAPFLAGHFDEIHLIDPRYTRENVLEYAKKHQIQEVLMLFSVENLCIGAGFFALVN